MPLNGTLHLSRSVRALVPREASLAPAPRRESFLPYSSSSSPPDRTTPLPTDGKNDTTMTAAPPPDAAPVHSSIIPSFYRNPMKPKRQRERSAGTSTGASPSSSSAATPTASSTGTPSAATTNSSTPQIPSSDPPVPETPASDACAPTPPAAGPSSAIPSSMDEFEGIEELSDSDFAKLPVSTRKRRRRLNGSSTAPSSSVAPAPSSSVAPGSDAKPIDLSTSSPTERSSERLPSSSPQRRTPRKSRRRIIESDSEAEWSPPRCTSSPVKRASSPAKDPSPPVTRSSSPVKRASRASSTVKRASSVVKRTASPHSASGNGDDDGDDEGDADVPPQETHTPRSTTRPARSGRAVFNGYYAQDAANFEKAMGGASDDEPVRKSVRKSVPPASKAKSKSKTPPVEDDTEVDTDGSLTPTARDKGKGKELPTYFAEDELCSDESDDDEPLRKRLRKRRDAEEDMFDEMDDAGIDYDALPFSEVGLEIADFPEFMSQMPRFRTPLDGEDDYPVADVEADEVSVASVENEPVAHSRVNGKTADGEKDPSRMFGLHLIHYLPDEDLQAFYRNHWRRGADLSSEDEDNAAGITRAPPRKSFGNSRGPAFRGRGKAFRGRRGATRGLKRK